MDVNDEYMLTTIDNPFNPFTQWDEWFAYDVREGHHTCAFLARVVHTSYDLSERDQLLDIDQAIDEIVSQNLNGLYVKVTASGEIKNSNETKSDNSNNEESE